MTPIEPKLLSDERLTAMLNILGEANPNVIANLRSHIAALEQQKKTDGDVLYMNLAGRLITRIVKAADMSLPDATDIELSLARIISDRDKLQQQLTSAHKDSERLVEALIKYADESADFMEGEGMPEFGIYEDQMCWAIRTLEDSGVKYDPISGTRSAIAQTKEKE